MCRCERVFVRGKPGMLGSPALRYGRRSHEERGFAAAFSVVQSPRSIFDRGDYL